jgi:hypothetical protein
VISSGDDGGCRQERREAKACVWTCFFLSGSDRVVVVHDGVCCCIKHSEGTHAKLGDEASLRGGSVADSIRGNLYCLAKK